MNLKQIGDDLFRRKSANDGIFGRLDDPELQNIDSQLKMYEEIY